MDCQAERIGREGLESRCVPRPEPLAVSFVKHTLNLKNGGTSSRRFALLPSTFIIVSLAGLFLLAMLTFYSHSPMIPFQRQLVGSAFVVICTMGAIAGVASSRCSRLFHYRGNGSKQITRAEKANDNSSAVKIEGHHPNCGRFSAHIIRFGSKICCAGCLGLVAGALLAIFGSLLYFFVSVNAADVGMIVFWLGVVGVCLGLLQYSKPLSGKASVHFSLNVAFVVGAFLLLVGVDVIHGGFALESYLLVLISYWIITRIMLSQWEHKKICAACGRKECSFFAIQRA